MGANLFVNFETVFAAILFGIGLTNLIVNKNLIKKIIGLNIMDTAVYLFLAAMGYDSSRIDSAVRISFGRETEKEDIDELVAALKDAMNTLCR